MSDGGFDVDKHIKKRVGSTKIHSPIFNKKGKYYISFPDMEEGDGVGESTESKNTTKSEIIESNSSENLWIAGTIQQDGRKNEIKPTQEPSESKLSVTLASTETNSLAKDNISDRPSLDDQDKLSKISTTKPPLIKKMLLFLKG